MIDKVSKVSVSAFIAISSALIFTNTVFAQPPESQEHPGKNKQAQALIKRSDLASAAAARREEGKLRACQARENAIKQRSTHLTQLVNSMLAMFDKHAQRVENYYTTKVVPAGKTVTNYNSLVADIAAKRAAVATALTQAQNDASSFSCTSSDPKTQLIKFKTDMQSVKKALKDYRTSIKNLIVAVHSVTGTINRTEASGSAKVNNK